MSDLERTYKNTDDVYNYIKSKKEWITQLRAERLKNKKAIKQYQTNSALQYAAIKNFKDHHKDKDTDSLIRKILYRIYLIELMEKELKERGV